MRPALYIIALCVLSVAPSRGEIIDRVLAVVEGQIITLSDVRAVLKLGLVPADVSVDPVAAAMRRLVDRQLMLAEVDRYAPPEPTPAAVDAAMLEIERRFTDALGLEIALNSTSMSREELRRFLRDSLRIDEYLRQRFATVLQPSEDEVVRYYREHSAEFTVGGGLRPFDQVRDAAREGAVAAARAALIASWVEGLRRRASVSVLYLPQSR